MLDTIQKSWAVGGHSYMKIASRWDDERSSCWLGNMHLCTGSAVFGIQPKDLRELLKRQMARQSSKSEFLIWYHKALAVVWSSALQINNVVPCNCCISINSPKLLYHPCWKLSIFSLCATIKRKCTSTSFNKKLNFLLWCFTAFSW